MIKDVDLGWLAGIIDGEGSISISRNPDDTDTIQPAVTITNTSLEILIRCWELMDALGVEGHRIDEHDVRSKNRNTYRLYVCTILGIKTLLRAVLPQLTGKRLQAELMLEYMERRSPSARVAYSARDIEIAKLISKLNRGILDSVTTARDPQETVMIQSGLHGDMQSTAETTVPFPIRRKA